MTKSSPILWLSEQLAQGLAVLKAPEPIKVWDNEARTFLETQETNSEGVPLWRTQVLMGVGWAGDLAPVEVRIPSRTKPKLKPNPQALLALVGGSAAPQRPAPGSNPSQPQRRA